MFAMEKKFLAWIEKNLSIIVIILGSVFSLIIRYALKDIESGDYKVFLEGWYDQILNGGGIHSLKRVVGNYNFLYQMCIAIMTYFPIKALYAYKILSVFFDYLLAITVAILVWSVSEEDKKNKAFTAYLIVICSPIVMLNSAAWGQCDAIYVFWAVAAICALIKEKYLLSFILLGISFSFKLQPVFILPFFIFTYFVKRKFSILNFIAIPLTMICANLGGVLFGRSIFEIFLVYFNQTNAYKQVALNYPSFWTLFFNAGDTAYYDLQHPVGMLMTVVVLLVLMTLCINKKFDLNNKNLIYMAFILSYTCVLFLPQMHERYGYLYEILAIVVLFLNKNTIKLIVPLYIITFSTYGKYLFGLSHSVDLYTGIANTLVWFGYIHIIFREFDKSRQALM